MEIDPPTGNILPKIYGIYSNYRQALTIGRPIDRSGFHYNKRTWWVTYLSQEYELMSFAATEHSQVGQIESKPLASANLLVQLGIGSSKDHRYLLLLRFIVINATAFAITAVLAQQGWFDSMIRSDTTHLIAIIVAAFLTGLMICGRKIYQTSNELNSIKESAPREGTRTHDFLSKTRNLDAQGRANVAEGLRLRLATRIGMVKHIASSLVFLGLIGTVIGFIIALSGVDPDSAADVTSIGPMVTTLISGMSIALYTTLVGSVLNIWLMLNYRLLESGTVNLIVQLVEYSEAQNARS